MQYKRSWIHNVTCEGWHTHFQGKHTQTGGMSKRTSSIWGATEEQSGGECAFSEETILVCTL